MNTIEIPKPTIYWREQLNEGSEFFTDEAIKGSDKLIDTYLNALKNAEDESAIWKAIENVVKAFDELNVEYDYFIETMEREDLAEYIQKAAEAAGLFYDGDVTEEWREEW